MKKTLVVAYHGILTGRSLPTWPERLEMWAAGNCDGVVVLTDHYKAGPFPWLNVFWKNPKAAKDVDAVVENYLDGTTPGGIDVHFVGHSNGCDIIRRCALRLLRRGYRVASVAMFSAPCSASVQAMGFRPYLESGELGRLLVYAADDDSVLAPNFCWKSPSTWLPNLVRWPYGNAGRVGLKDGDQTLARAAGEVTGRAVTRIFPGWGHGDFFPLSNPGRMVGMFETYTRDAGIPRKR